MEKDAEIHKGYIEFIERKAKEWEDVFKRKTDIYGVPWADLMIDQYPYKCFEAGVEWGRKRELKE